MVNCFTSELLMSEFLTPWDFLFEVYCRVEVQAMIFNYRAVDFKVCVNKWATPSSGHNVLPAWLSLRWSNSPLRL
jgi:hypothetical protein